LSLAWIISSGIGAFFGLKVLHANLKEGGRMVKEWKNRITLLAATVLVSFATGVGCESEGPAEKAGKSIDKGVQDAKDAISPPGTAEKAGRAVDRALER
jgi:hypothetical protein